MKTWGRVALLLTGVALSMSFGQPESPSGQVLEGRLTVTGNEPFAQLVLETESETYSLQGTLVPELWQHQNQVVRLRVEVTRAPTSPRLPGVATVLEVLSAPPPTPPPRP